MSCVLLCFRDRALMVAQAGFKLMIILVCPNLSNARVTGGSLHTQLQYFLEHCSHYDTWTCHGCRGQDVLRRKRNYQSEFTLCWSHLEDSSTYFLTAFRHGKYKVLMVPFLYQITTRSSLSSLDPSDLQEAFPNSRHSSPGPSWLPPPYPLVFIIDAR